MKTEVSPQDLRSVLREQFGHEIFRPGQERIVRDLLQGRDVLAVLPTGAGKSLAYQLAAQLLPGLTLVVSPLLALMKDQVESLEERAIEVSVINSAQSERDSAEALDAMRNGQVKLLYVTPERFDDEEFLAEVRRREVSLLVVDEAHCISEWGHSFRPSYLALGNVAAVLGKPTCLALTATATPWVRRDIIDRLGLRDPDVVVHGNDRPNLFFEVRRVEAEDEDRRVLERLLTGDQDEYPPDLAERLARAMVGSGIIYTATTRGAKETAEWLRGWGIAADYYHGQRRKSDRERVQEAFMAGDLRVIVATNAFGLGIDKPDIRFVIHRDIPASLEAYYQEAGRAGRDGEFARCTIIYRPGDLGRAAFLAGGGSLTREDITQARPGLVAQRQGTWREMQAATGLSRGNLTRLVNLLKCAGIVEEKRGRIRLLRPDFDPDAISLETEERRRAYERSRLEMVRGYAEARECRRRYLLNYFGEDYPAEGCNLCDVETRTVGAQRVMVEPDEVLAAPFALQDRVVHDAWGKGIVQRVTNDRVTVLFDQAGYKTLAMDLVLKEGLLRAEESQDAREE